MTLIRNALRYRKCGLRVRDAVRVAMLERELLKLKGKVK